MEFDYGMYSVYTTRQMMRVARLVTPPEDASRWILTIDGRVWRMDAGSWVSTVEGDTRRHREGDMRDFLTEQLFEYDVAPDSPMWESY